MDIVDGVITPDTTHPKRRNGGAIRTLAAALTMVALMTGCATTQSADSGEADNDPIESLNRHIYQVNDFIDQTIGKPVATTYLEYIPRPVRNSVSNFFDNVAYPNTILNNFLQGKVHQGFRAAGRFFVNSTFGFLGVWDMATPLGLHAQVEDFGQTLSLWGVNEGAYMVLPFLGPNTIRDAPGLGVGTVTNILFYVSNPFVVPIAILGFVDKRARAEEAINLRDRIAIEPYLFTREAYRQHREFLTYDGDPLIEDEWDFDETLTDGEVDEAPSLQEEPGAP